MEQMQPIIAELVVENVDASIFWYRGLGFEVDGEGLRDDDGLQWVSMTRDGRPLWLLRADLSPDDARGAPSVRLYLQVENVDTIYEQLTARNVLTESAPETQWYGLREFSVRDPDGYHWILNHPVPEDQRPPAPSPGPLPGLG
jgi:uncharacterized glyoxalase superfamily protein PhnB